MAKTAIEWATDVWNPFTGCDRVSPGCAKCYALEAAASLKRKEAGRLAKARDEGKPEHTMRYQVDGDPRTSGPGFGFTVHWDKLEKPPSFTRGGRVFVNSMSDVFHEEAPLEALAAMWGVFAERPQTSFLVLTKRPERMLEMVPLIRAEYEAATGRMLDAPWPLPNVWLGVSIENRRFVHRADLLRQTPAAIRFISAEPLLGPLVPSAGETVHAGSGPFLNLTDIDWLIVGGESGQGHRPIEAEWGRDLRDACLAQCMFCQKTGEVENCTDRTTRFFFKQWGGRRAKDGGRELDGRTWDEFPKVTQLAVS
jgi:protein gp37